MKQPPDQDELALVLDLGLFQELRESLGHELEVVTRIYRRFLGHAADNLAASRGQTGSERATTLHTLKGSAAMVGAHRVADLAGELQDALLHVSDEEAEAAIGRLEDELTRFRLALTAHLEEKGPGRDRGQEGALKP